MFFSQYSRILYFGDLILHITPTPTMSSKSKTKYIQYSLDSLTLDKFKLLTKNYDDENRVRVSQIDDSWDDPKLE